jgi:hypothetical protein
MVISNETINHKNSEESELRVRPSANEEDQNEVRRFAKVLHENAKENPDIWRSSARMFKRAADIVLIEVDKDEDGKPPSQESPLSDIYVFLMSVAIENILKGILRASGKRSYTQLTRNHDISKLYDYCREWYGFPVTEEDGELLSILTYAADWAGRFNLPKKSEPLEDAFEKHGLTLSYINNGLSISLPLSKHAEAKPGELKATRGKINALYERLYAKFEEVMAAGQ